jgi:hypothetical protein
MKHTLAGRERRNLRDEDLLDFVHNNTSTCTSHISSAKERLPQSAVWRNLGDNQLYPFHVQPVEGLQPGDKHLRLQFSRLVLYKIVYTPEFLCRVLWTDEAVFTRSDEESIHLACIVNGESSCYSSLLTPAQI